MNIYTDVGYPLDHEILTLLVLSGLFSADRIGCAMASQHDGTHSPSASDDAALLSSSFASLSLLLATSDWSAAREQVILIMILTFGVFSQ